MIQITLLKQPAGHDRLCGCEECVAFYVHLAEQRLLDVHKRATKPQRTNSKYNPLKWRER